MHSKLNYKEEGCIYGKNVIKSLVRVAGTIIIYSCTYTNCSCFHKPKFNQNKRTAQ